MDHDPRALVGSSKLSRFQVVAILATLTISAVDGFDILAVTFALPGVREEWSLTTDVLGMILSAGALGMAFGCLAISPLADRFGRRRIILSSLALVILGMTGSACATGPINLSVFRILAGCGIGGLIGPVNAMAAEFSNHRWRALALSVMACGYGLGGLAGGGVAAVLLESFGWRSVFFFGSIISIGAIIFAYRCLPESIDFLVELRSPTSLLRINDTLKRMGHTAISQLPDARTDAAFRDPFKPAQAGLIALIALMYFFHASSNYFFAGWVPTLMADNGFSPGDGAHVMMFLSGGGIVGTLLFGALARVLSFRLSGVAAFFGAGAAFYVLGKGASNLRVLEATAALAGLCAFAAIVCLYMLVVTSFPAQTRATVIGWVTAASRLGAVFAPSAAGYMMIKGIDREAVISLMACGSISAGSLLAVFSLGQRIKSKRGASDREGVMDTRL